MTNMSLPQTPLKMRQLVTRDENLQLQTIKILNYKTTINSHNNQNSEGNIKYDGWKLGGFINKNGYKKLELKEYLGNSEYMRYEREKEEKHPLEKKPFASKCKIYPFTGTNRAKLRLDYYNNRHMIRAIPLLSRFHPGRKGQGQGQGEHKYRESDLTGNIQRRRGISNLVKRERNIGKMILLLIVLQWKIIISLIMRILGVV